LEKLSGIVPREKEAADQNIILESLSIVKECEPVISESLVNDTSDTNKALDTNADIQNESVEGEVSLSFEALSELEESRTNVVRRDSPSSTVASSTDNSPLSTPPITLQVGRYQYQDEIAVANAHINTVTNATEVIFASPSSSVSSTPDEARKAKILELTALSPGLGLQGTLRDIIQTDVFKLDDFEDEDYIESSNATKMSNRIDAKVVFQKSSSNPKPIDQNEYKKKSILFTVVFGVIVMLIMNSCKSSGLQVNMPQYVIDKRNAMSIDTAMGSNPSNCNDKSLGNCFAGIKDSSKGESFSGKDKTDLTSHKVSYFRLRFFKTNIFKKLLYFLKSIFKKSVYFVKSVVNNKKTVFVN